MEGKLPSAVEANAETLCTTAPVIRELSEWEEWLTKAADTAVLLQCGSPQCKRCPPVSAMITVLKEEYQFHHVYVNTHDAEDDLLEYLQVTQLPAYLLVKRGDQAKGQSATPDEVQAAVVTLCTPVFTMDADF